MEVWKSYIDDHSDILEGRLPPNKSTAVRRAAECGLSDLVAEHFVGEAKERTRRQLEPFWAAVEGNLELHRPAPLAPDAIALETHVYLANEYSWVEPVLCDGVRDLCYAVERTCSACLALAECLRSASTSAYIMLTEFSGRVVQAQVLSTALCPLAWVLRIFYSQHLHEFAAAAGHPLQVSAAAEHDTLDEDIPDMDKDDERMDTSDAISQLGADWPKRLRCVTQGFSRLGLGPLTEEAFTASLSAALRRHLLATASTSYEQAALPAAQRWLTEVPLPFLRLCLGDEVQESTERILSQWRFKLDQALFEALGTLRIGELFDIIVDYPESMPALLDLRNCLANTALVTTLGASFRATLQRRLLLPGAATSDILSQYVSTIRALRELDPSGSILKDISEPIKTYLRGRRDTMRCIVTMLTEDAGNGRSLLEELAAESSSADLGEADVDGADVVDLPGWEAWEPEAVDIAPTTGNHALRSADIVSLLVDIYGSKELFVTEYRAMLAERLLTKAAYDTDREVRTLELLKLRFGDEAMLLCDVMLKDMADSKRIDSNIKAAAGLSSGLETTSATILSSLFWPALGAEAAMEFNLPPAIETKLAAYWQRFHTIKAPRKLVWKKTLGTVRLLLTIGGVQREFVVSPLHASIIMRFDGVSRWELDKLAEIMGVPALPLRRKMRMWVNAGVLTETQRPPEGLVYTVADALAGSDDEDAMAPAGGGEEERESVVASAEEQEAAGMRVYEQYVMGMLNNFDSLPLERIHNMLKMFVSEPQYDKSAQQLEVFLGRLVSEDKLLHSSRSYSKKR